MSKNAKTGTLYVLLGAALWGTLPMFSRYVYGLGSDPVTAAAMRAYLAAGVFFIWFLIDGTFKTVKLRELPFYLLYGLTGVGGTFLLYMMAVQRLSTAMAAMLLYTGPSFVVILSRIFYKEPITPVKLAALCCTFLGCFFVVGGYNLQSVNLPGVLIGLASGLAYSTVTVLGRKAKQLHDARTNAGLMIMLGSLLFLFLRPPWGIAVPSAELWFGYAGLAVFGSVLAYTFYLKGLDTGLDGGIASITATAEPVIATLLGVILLGDALEWPQILGILIVLFGVALPLLTRKRG
ncbi:MAG: EamA family transporter [Eubacteriales bacterium]|nr:EamA family transporter [Eubacteriales bacterium]